MSLKAKFKRFFELEDDDIEAIQNQNDWQEIDEDYITRGQDKKIEKANVVSLQSVQKSAKVMLLEPRTYDEVQDIADHLKNRKAVVINLQRISLDQATNCRFFEWNSVCYRRRYSKVRSKYFSLYS
jgi:cell division inhibitor SepF